MNSSKVDTTIQVHQDSIAYLNTLPKSNLYKAIEGF